MLELSLPLCALTIVIAAARKIAVTASVALLFLAALLLFALAAGDPTISLRHRGTVLVMVDLSPSTRTASFRRRDALMRRIDELLVDTPRQIIAFAQAGRPLPPDEILPDISVDQTNFSPPPADSVLLFSDGQFDLSDSSDPIFPVLDPALENPPDAAVTQLDFRNSHVIAAVQNTGPPRQLTWANAIAENSDPITASIFRSATPQSDAPVTVSLSPGDAWPENDSLSAVAPPPPTLQKWWIAADPARHPAPTWRVLPPSALSTNAAEYLNAAVIVLDDIDPDSLTTQQQTLLVQYVRDLGGGLLVIGRSGIATPIDAISPFTSSPPTPATRWVFLIDSSGSMAGTPFQAECAAIAPLPSLLPPADPVRFASFAQSLRWWPAATPPIDLFPHGPTDLASALSQILASSDVSLPTQLLILTDAQADLPSPAELAAAMNARKIHLSVLAIGDGNALPALASISSATGGSLLQQFDISQWAIAARKIVRDALPDRLIRQKIDFRFTGDLASLGARQISQWNRTWLRPGVIELAQSPAAPIAARWQVGSGQVAALAYRADIPDAQTLAALIAHPPRDPRFTVNVTTGPQIHLSIHAADLSALGPLWLDSSDATAAATSTRFIPQTAPGFYELDFPAPRRPVIASVRAGSHILDRFALAGRYPHEFDAIGNNRANLQALAERSGGQTIEPSAIGPIDFHWPPRQFSLCAILSAIAAALLAIGTVMRHRR